MNLMASKSSVFQDKFANYHSGDTGDSSIATLNTRRSQVRVSQQKSPWIQRLENYFNELTSLPKGWDGYDGQPVSFSCAQFAANLIERLCIDDIPAPQLVPGSDGTLQLEWHMNGFDVEVDVLAPFNLVASRFDHNTKEEDEIEIQADFTELANWVKALGEDREVLQQVGV